MLQQEPVEGKMGKPYLGTSPKLQSRLISLVRIAYLGRKWEPGRRWWACRPSPRHPPSPPSNRGFQLHLCVRILELGYFLRDLDFSRFRRDGRGHWFG